MAVDAVAVTLSSATATAPNGRAQIGLEVDNTNGSEAAVIAGVRLYATTVGATPRTIPVAFGEPARTGLASTAMGDNTGVVRLLCSVIPFAPQSGSLLPGFPATQDISIGADVTFSTGQVVVAIPVTLTVSAPSH